jgi:surfeit locus 1 family protein
MNVSRTTLFFCALALAVSLGCIRLGFWQLARLNERQKTNEQVIARLGDVAIPLERVPPTPGSRFRRVFTNGRYDFGNEFVLTSRSRMGAPGVNIITPLRTGKGDTAVLVNRGWAYAPDGMKVDLALFREDSNAVVDGFVEEYSASLGPVSTPSVTRAVRRLDHDSIAARLPYPLASVLIVQQMDSGEFTAVDRGTPVRVEPPPLGEGPHRAYAIQWFAFALVGIAGSALVFQRDRTRRAQGTKHA